ncbi:YciI family protein [uncultured Sphingomonas sp.]|uniref:YciI family protein n=1 Tax=uncultured Sphingomonas sp. TaxID=158754 RepID=UPI0026248F71|nr:YciI family protein [uncultured Sphingomonas sp.]
MIAGPSYSSMGETMSFFIVTMTHPDGEAWRTHLAAHVEYLNLLVADGTLKASGPLKRISKRSDFLIFLAKDEGDVRALVDKDPFGIEGLIETLSIIEWDPLFGQFANESSGQLAGQPVTAFGRAVS